MFFSASSKIQYTAADIWLHSEYIWGRKKMCVCVCVCAFLFAFVNICCVWEGVLLNTGNCWTPVAPMGLESQRLGTLPAKATTAVERPRSASFDFPHHRFPRSHCWPPRLSVHLALPLPFFFNPLSVPVYKKKKFYRMHRQLSFIPLPPLHTCLFFSLLQYWMRQP